MLGTHTARGEPQAPNQQQHHGWKPCFHRRTYNKKIPLCCNCLEEHQQSGVLRLLLLSHSISHLGNVHVNLLPVLSLLPELYTSLCLSGFEIFQQYRSYGLLYQLEPTLDTYNDSLLFIDGLTV